MTAIEGNTSLKLSAVNPDTGAVDPDFRPAVNSFMGVRAIDASAGALAVGGHFTTVSGVSARHLAVFP